MNNTYVKEMAAKTEHYIKQTDDIYQEHLPVNEIVVNIDDQKAAKTDIVTKLKCITLHEMGKHPLLNTNNLSKTEKQLLIQKMQSYLDNITTANNDITNKFNKICNETIFNDDYTLCPIYMAAHQKIERI